MRGSMCRAGSARAVSLFLAGALVLTAMQGCAVLVYDKGSGTQHLYGCGALRMRSEPGNQDVVAVQLDTVGISAGTVVDGAVFSLGWQQVTSVRVLDPDTAASVEWPQARVFYLKVTEKWPPADRNRSAESGTK